MPRINPVDVQNNDAATGATLNAVKTKLGMLPNLISTLAQSPAALNGYLQLSEAVGSGRLTSRQREQIAIAVAQENACEYCLSAHAVIGKSVGLDSDDIEHARDGRAVDRFDAAVTAFALNVTRSKATISDADLEAARSAGLDDGLIIEVIANVALNVLTNYVNRVAGTTIDFPVTPLKAAA